MKRYFCFLLTTAFLLLTGCSLTDDAAEKAARKEIQPEATKSRAAGIPEKKAEKTQSIPVTEPQPKDEEQKAEEPKAEEVPKTSLVLYYQDGQGLVLPVTRRVGKQDGIAKAAVTALVDTTFNREEIEYFGIYPVLPLGTEIKGMNIKEGTATIDFNSNLLNYKDKTAERNIVTAVVYTLTEFKNISNVKIRINSQEQKKLKFGTELSMPLGRENTLINADKANIGQQKQKFDIFLTKPVNDMYDYIVPVSVETSPFKPEELPAKITEAITRDWSKVKLYTSIPQGTRLIKAQTEGNMLSLDFSCELRSYGGGTAREDALIRQILYSSRQIKGVEKVKILVNGKENDLPEGTDMTGGLPIPGEINSFVDQESPKD